MVLNRTMKYWSVITLAALANSIVNIIGASSSDWLWTGIGFATVWHTAEWVGKSGLGESV